MNKLAFGKDAPLTEKAKKELEKKESKHEDRQQKAATLLRDILERPSDNKPNETPTTSKPVAPPAQQPQPQVQVRPGRRVGERRAREVSNFTRLYIPAGGERTSVQIPMEYLFYVEDIVKGFRKQGIKIRIRDLIPLCSYIIKEFDEKKLSHTFNKMIADVEGKKP